MVKDSYERSHPIKVDVINPNEITSLFDSISYDKVNIYFILSYARLLKNEDEYDYVDFIFT